MPEGIDPLELAQEDAKALYSKWMERLVDWGKKYVTVALLKVLLPSVGAIALAMVALPSFAAVACGLAILLLSIYSINATRLLKRKDAEVRWAWVQNHRLRQRLLDQQIAVDNVTLTLMGERTESRSGRFVPSDLRSALAVVKRREADAEARAIAAEAVRGGTATDAQRRAVASHRRVRSGPAPSGPQLGPIKARKAAREAEHAELTARIDALATPGDVERAMRAEDATRTRRERQTAAVEADKAARQRVRRGQRPTVAEPEHTIVLGTTQNGDRDVRTGRARPTPEQIARGDVGKDGGG